MTVQNFVTAQIMSLLSPLIYNLVFSGTWCVIEHTSRPCYRLSTWRASSQVVSDTDKSLTGNVKILALSTFSPQHVGFRQLPEMNILSTKVNTP